MAANWHEQLIDAVLATHGELADHDSAFVWVTVDGVVKTGRHVYNNRFDTRAAATRRANDAGASGAYVLWRVEDRYHLLNACCWNDERGRWRNDRDFETMFSRPLEREIRVEVGARSRPSDLAERQAA